MTKNHQTTNRINMILTDKAKNDFNSWMFREYADDFGIIEVEPRNLTISFWDIDDFLQNTVIIDWFDSVGIYIHIIPQTDCVGTAFYYTIKGYTNGEYYPKRHQAISAAITEANKIYNRKYK